MLAAELFHNKVQLDTGVIDDFNNIEVNLATTRSLDTIHNKLEVLVLARANRLDI